MSVSDVMSRISAIQGRFGYSSIGFIASPDVSQYIPLIDEEQLATSPIAEAAAVGAPMTAELLELLTVQRGDAGLVQTPSSALAQRFFPVAGEETGSGFGVRSDPFTGEERMHRGVDIGAAQGAPVLASAAGVVSWAGERGSYGQLVKIDHGDGVETRYAHQSRIDVSVGDIVEAGQQIGAVGSTGRSTGPHLHFEVRVGGDAVDPAVWLGA
ncbi:MAG: M23 family metallopeptidase [Actinomycetia bacterium]|nr:M23 family metallopeptidase [Actinomycetes bacterium]